MGKKKTQTERLVLPPKDGSEILADPLSAIQSLDPAEIERRLEELEGQARALRILLRSARRAQPHPYVLAKHRPT